MIKLYPHEIDALVALNKLNYFVSVHQRGYEGWESIWGMENGPQTILSSEEEIKEFFSKPIEIEDPAIFCFNGVTHCGGFHFQLGWVHNIRVTQEELEEACVPHRRGIESLPPKRRRPIKDSPEEDSPEEVLPLKRKRPIKASPPK